jgi:uncharacterized membrane protein
MLRPYWLSLIFLALCMSCTQKQKVKFTPPRDEVVDTSVISAAPMSIDTASRKAVTFNGLYTHGNEVSTFRDCKTGKLYWLTDSTGEISKRYAATNRYPAYPYESVYAEVTGYLKGKSTVGYASEYENELIVKSVIKVEAKNFQTSCYPFEFIALGNEPFWAVEIIPAEERIVLKDAGNDKVYQFPYKKGTTSGDVYTYEVTNEKKAKLRVSIRKQKCSDGMSDRQYLYSAAVTINGKLLNGCAIRKGDQLTGNP